MSKIYDPLLEKDQDMAHEGGEAAGPTLAGGWSTKKLCSISNLDNQHADGNAPRTSSTIIMNEFGGIEGLVQGLESNEVTGIDPSTVVKRRQIHGSNAFPPPKIKTLCELILENFHDPINLVLCGAAAVSIVVGIIQEGFPEGLTEGLSIMVALVIIFFVNSANNYSSEKQLAKMVMQADDKQIAVWRGKPDPDMIGNDQLVVGDIYRFENGMKIPADCVMVSGQDVMCTETDLTGEPDQFAKVRMDDDKATVQELSGVLLAKSLCVAGKGQAIVIAVGENTPAGALSDNSVTDEETDLQKKLAIIANKIGWVGIFAAVLTFISMVVRSILEGVKVIPCGCGNIMSCQAEADCVPLSFEFTKENRLWTQVLESVIIAISVVVCAIPEGLPLAVAISLSFSSAQMKKLNNLVRNLNSSETMGSATHICSDKTGTLTQNKMTVMACMIAGKAHQIKDQNHKATLLSNVKDHGSNLDIQDTGINIWQFIYNSIMWNSSAFFTQVTADMKENQADSFKSYNVGDWATQGNVTEQAILNFFLAEFGGEGCVAHKKSVDSIQEDIIGFTSKRKKASIIVKTDNGYRLYCKGAPDMLFPASSHYVGLSGDILDMDDTAEFDASLLNQGESSASGTGRDMMDRTVSLFAKQALRTILMTYRDFSEEEYDQLKSDNNDFAKEEDREVLEQGLTAVGIWGIQDPLRDGITAAITKCKFAGIKVIMCTGDNLDTAVAISKNAGIVTEEAAEGDNKEYTCTTGKEFREKVGEDLLKETDAKGKVTEHVRNMNEFRKYYDHLRVLARSSPLDKRILVTGIQACDGVVAVTGDGSNDAPALKKADVGFSMGITGTDIAKGASDIILLDDNFTSIVVALKYGRNVYDSVRKFLQFQLAVNLTAMAIVFFGSAILSDSPLNAVQMLWVNLVMDTFGALALATEPPMDDILERKPYPKSDSIVNEVMWRNIFGHAIFQIIVLAICIFTLPGVMTENYWMACTTPVTDMSKCEEWNPFYTNVLYETEKSKVLWEKRGQAWSNGATPYAFYNQTLLQTYHCKTFAEKNADWEYNAANCKSVFDTAFAAKTVHTPANAEDYEHTEKMLHYTIIFQVFVFMQIFNLINSRKIGDEKNVFANFFNNKYFIIIFILTILIQCCLVELGGTAVKTYALNLNQNLICLAFGFTELPWGLLLKFMPLKWFQCIQLSAELPDEDEDEDDKDGEKKKKASGGAIALKRLSTQKSKLKTSSKQKTKA